MNRRQILIGILVLFIGALVYVVDRPGEQTYFVYQSAVNISVYNTLPNLFGIIGNSLPSFTHVFSFILITAGLIAYQKRGYILICLFWFFVDSAFELGQKFNTLIIEYIPGWLGGIPFFENTGNYFMLGTFSFGDMAAIFVGTIAAYFTLMKTTERRTALSQKRTE